MPGGDSKHLGLCQGVRVGQGPSRCPPCPLRAAAQAQLLPCLAGSAPLSPLAPGPAAPGCPALCPPAQSPSGRGTQVGAAP